MDLAREAALVRQWWMPASGAEPSAGLAAEFDALVADATASVAPVREVLVLRGVEGMAEAEVAAVLGISGKAVETRLYRARRKLADMLGHE
mgnify:CR=1 FL=1